MEKLRRMKRVALAALDTGGGVLSLANPEGQSLIVTNLVIHITTVATAACTLDAGIAAAATTLSDTIMDGQDANAAIGAFAEKGTNGKFAKLWTSGQFLTISVATGAAAGLVGYAFVEYMPAA